MFLRAFMWVVCMAIWVVVAVRWGMHGEDGLAVFASIIALCCAVAFAATLAFQLNQERKEEE